MAKLTALLIGMLLTCSLLLVTSQHRARKAFIELERAQSAARRHEVEWNRLQFEQTRLAKHSLIDAAARRDLRMLPVPPERTIYLGAPAPAASAPAAPAASASVPPATPAQVAAARGVH